MKVQIELITDDGALFRGEAILVQATKRSARSKSALEPAKSARVNCAQSVRHLWEKGKFRSPLSFSDVKNELSLGGFNFPNNTLMMALSAADYLTRRGSKRSYTWSQRHPY